MFTTKINFQDIDNRVQAAWKLQDGNKDDESKMVLLSLAKDILKVLDTKK